MLRILTTSSILALAAIPALAKQTETAPMAPDNPTTTEQPAPAEPAPTQPTPADKAAQAAAVVEAEFPSYDTDASGELNQTEFGAWMLALHAKAEADGVAGAQGKTADQKDAWVKQAFLAADKDKSTKVSKAELTTFLKG